MRAPGTFGLTADHVVREREHDRVLRARRADLALRPRWPQRMDPAHPRHHRDDDLHPRLARRPHQGQHHQRDARRARRDQERRLRSRCLRRDRDAVAASRPAPAPAPIAATRSAASSARPIKPAQVTRYAYDGPTRIVRQRPNGTTFDINVDGAGLDEHVAMITGATRLFLHQDRLGSVYLVTDSLRRDRWSGPATPPTARPRCARPTAHRSRPTSARSRRSSASTACRTTSSPAPSTCVPAPTAPPSAASSPPIPSA